MTSSALSEVGHRRQLLFLRSRIAGEDVPVGRIQHAELGSDGGDVGTQERVGFELAVEPRRQRRLILVAQPVDLLGAIDQRQVVRLQRQREAGVRLGVLVPAIDLACRAAAA